MIIVMRKNATESDIAKVIDTIHKHGLTEHVSRGTEVTIIGAVGDERIFDPAVFECLEGVDRAVQILQDWRIISRDDSPQDMIITARKVRFGAEPLFIRHLNDQQPVEALDGERCFFLDPFQVSNRPYEPVDRAKFETLSARIRDRTSEIHDLGATAMVRIRDRKQLDAALWAEADVVYVGGELMNNWAMNKELGRLNTPLVLCKDKHHTVDDWLMAAERIALEGNRQIILGEAGTMSFNTKMSARLDVESMVVATRLSHLPVLANICPLISSMMSETVLRNIALAAGAKLIIGRSAPWIAA